jgi:hypothetical protein
LLLALLAVLALTVCALADGEGDEPDTDTVVEVADQTVEIVSDPDAPQDNDELFYEYMLRLAREQMTPARPTREPTRGVHEQEMGLRSGGADGSRPPANVETAGSKLTGNDLIIYNQLKTFIQSVAAGERNTSTIEIPMSLLSFTVQGTENKYWLDNEYYYLDEDGNRTDEAHAKVIGKYFTWTREQLGVPADTPFTSGGYINSVISDALRENVFCYHPTQIVDALMVDLPYDFYWYNKTNTEAIPGGYSYIMDGSLLFDGENTKIMLDAADASGSALANEYQITFTFYVAQAYAVGTYLNPDTTKLAAAKTTAQNALTVVNDHASESDYDKLVSYRQFICDAVEYNQAAVENKDTPYGDPWQLIWAFDNNSATNIVCEGYSKAFKYLCDLSTFQHDIQCYIATGNMGGGTGAGGHMWNVVTMDDGANYLVDVTNCDTGSIGAPDKLFLKGVSKDVSGTLTSDNGTFAKNYKIIGIGIEYAYDTETITVWGKNGAVDGSLLDVSTTDYTPPTGPVYTPVADGNYSYNYDGTTLLLDLTSAKLIVACYQDGKMIAVHVLTDDGSVTLTGNDWAVFSVDANYAPLCGALRKADVTP